MKEYEEWQKKGFKAKQEEFGLSKKEQDRLMDLMGGSALRKGSKHRQAKRIGGARKGVP